ncbi:MAG TPA: hypothetical protein VFB67_11230 [Candidatus Polarisedimenticolaceae bacterium]|nr:hypothetical protein [Candidatus Polarisedimenticolaceae bacterium]
MTQTGAPGSDSGAILDRILSGTASLPVRQAAARGALPLPRAMLTRLYLHLRGDADEAVRFDAASSLSRMTPDVVTEVLGDPACHAVVLAHFAAAAARDDALAEKVAFHPNADAKALSVLASEGNAAVLELVLTNQERLLSTPGLIDKLSVNPALRADQRGRLLDLIDRFFEDETAKSAGPQGTAGEPVATIDAEQVAKILDVDVGELFAASEIMDAQEFEQSPDLVVRSAYKKILTLNTAQKAILAMKGGREERAILVRDTNKVVSLSVLKNPRLTEGEVESIAAMRNVSDEILRNVGINREWAKNYAVMANLVRNPRTPPSISTNFVSRLNSKDLKILGGDRNVPEIIRKMAKRTFDLRTQQAATSYRKK